MTQATTIIRRLLKRDGLNPTTRGRGPDTTPVLPLQDYAGRTAMVTRFGDQVVAERQPDISIQFQYNLATDDVTAATAGGATAAVSGAQAILTTAAGNSSASIESVRPIRYRPGHEGFAFFTAALGGAGAGLAHRIGPHDGTNGWWFGSIDGVFGVGWQSGGAETFIPQSGFELDKMNGDGMTGFEVDWTALGIRRIAWGFLGIAPIDFEVHGNSTRGFVPCHTIDLTNLRNTPHITNPVLPMRASIARTSGSGVATLRTASWCAGTIGPSQEEVGNRYRSAYNAKTLTGGARTNLFTIRSPATFQGLTNRVWAHLNRLRVATDGTKTVEVAIFENATLGGTPSYAAVDAVNSVLEIDTAGTTVTGGTRISTFPVGKAESRDYHVVDDNIRLRPGNTWTFAALSANASDVNVSARWHEEF